MSRTKRSGFYIEATGEEDRYDSSRDKKKGYKANKAFKKSKSRSEKAKIKAAIRNEKELPVFKKDNEWDWN